MALTRTGVWGRAFNRFINQKENASVIQSPGRKILNGNQVNLLRLNLDDGYMVDAGGNALLQNKHGNPKLARKYREANKKLFIRKWTGGRAIDTSPLYRIRARLYYRRARSAVARILKRG